MMILFLPYLLSIFNYYLNQDIVVEHVYLDGINVSSIADDVLIFELNKDYSNIRHLVLSEDFYYLSPGEIDYKGFSVSVSKLDKAGTFIKEIYRPKDPKLITSLGYYPEKNLLFVAHNKSILSIDTNADKVVREVKVDKSITRILMFKNKLYVAGFEYTDESETYYLDVYDPLSLKLLDTKKEMNYVAGDKAFRHSSITSNDSELFVAMGTLNEIYSSVDDFKKPVLTFKNIYNNKPSGGNILFSSNQGLVGKFATTYFKYLNSNYFFIYDLKSDKQYLSKKGKNSGFYDDLKNTGFYSPLLTNSSEYMFSYKKYDTNENKILVVLFKIKS
ncbi:YncE family protein [Algoriphagus ratkowskyi]|nr:hypothetical protein [Algoriphagus ratkowskyi]TXD75336.1 hypothetical protein ESW18_20870 [Algoriphagus ratkowskyi]